MTKKKLPLEAASIVAEAFCHHLEPHAERIEVAGSIRRRKPEVGDIEIVMIPKLYREPDLLGQPSGPWKDTIQQGIDSYIRCESPDPERPALVKLNDGVKYIKLHETIIDVQIDLFVVRKPAQWGPIISIRTGSAAFSKQLVIDLKKRGLRSEDGRVLDENDNQIDCPEEINFFRAAGRKMIAPWLREVK
jgi:DNA polymerase/3'-5' exonuclease PolX